MTRYARCLAVCLVLAAGNGIRGQAQLVLYDDFNDPRIAPEKWTGGGQGALEVIRAIRADELRLSNGSYGETTSNLGAQTGQVIASFVNEAAVTAIAVITRIENVRVAGCDGTAAPAYADANIFGSFFNAAVPTPGSHLNDVTAAIRVSRLSNSADPTGILQITAAVSQCQNADCSIATGLGGAALGMVARDVPVRLGVQWQPENNRFAFHRNNAAPVFITYTVPDDAAPGNPHKFLGTLAQVPNCTSAQRPFGFIAASFDNVFVNAAAVP